VTAFEDALRDLARDLLETMHAAPGIGITAPHIGVSLRVVVLDLDANDGARTYVNPEIIWASPEMIQHQEGSVSMPGVNDDTRRHARVRISYHDVHGPEISDTPTRFAPASMSDRPTPALVDDDDGVTSVRPSSPDRLLDRRS
jgi:peptide deformylase